MRRRTVAALTAALLAAGLIAGGPAGAGAQDRPAARTLVVGEAQVWSLAEALFSDGEYYRAVTEYKRLLSYFPGGPREPAAQERIAEALLLGGEPRQALDHIAARLERAPESERDRWRVLQAIGRLDLDKDRPYPLRRADIAQALADLKTVSPAYPAGADIAGFVRALEAPPELPRKSPALAGTLSAVLPGAGSLYVGRPAEAALSFFVNALLIAGTVTAFQEHQGGLGVGLGVLALAFYGGNVYAAVSGAHKANDGAEAAYLDEQRTRFGLVLERGKIGAAFQRGF
jgi:tetratricopeptide (TPR) repeat protein